VSKIFGIGLPKSGTSSLHEALKLLGYRSKHFPDDMTTENEIRSANYKLSILNRFDAIMDTPIPAIFAQLDNAWPGSKFILTIRPIDAWIESSRRAGFNQAYARPKPGSTVDFYNSILYGCSVFNEERFRWVYESYHKLVYDYFTGTKSNQLLILDFSKEIGWEELCKFLGKTIPEAPFPHSNPLSARIELTQSQKYIIGVLVKLGIDYRWLRSMGHKIRHKMEKKQ